MLRTMKSFCLLFAVLICALLFSACRRAATNGATVTSALLPGALCSLNDGEGGYRAGKIVAVENDITFMQLFAERWSTRPALDQVRKAGRPAPIAFTAQTMAGMEPLLLGNGTISAEETEAYETWKQSKREIF